MNVLDKFKLTDQHAVVTGASRGIGLAAAEALASAGASVTITGRDVARGEAAAETLRSAGYDVSFRAMDVTDPDDVRRTADAILAAHGRIDVLVNNAGICHNTGFLDITLTEWRDVIETNLTGVFVVSQIVARHMVTRGRGSIVNIGSNSGFIVDRPQPQSHYNTSKAGMHMLSKAMAVELAPHGLRVNVVAPGYTLTEMTKLGIANSEWSKPWLDMTPMGRFAEPQEMAPAIVFLASQASSFVTGEVILVDGGYTAW